MGKPVVRHAQQHPSRGRDAGQSAGEHTHQRTNIDQYPEHRHAAHPRQYMHLIGGSSQVLADDVEAQDFGVRADSEESSGQNGTLNHRAGDRLQRVASLRSQSRRTLKAHKAK